MTGVGAGYTALPAAPNPGETFTVPIPGGPTEQQATDTVVSYGWLIAIVLVGAVLIAIGRTIAKRIDLRFLGAVVVIGYVAYKIGTAK